MEKATGRADFGASVHINLDCRGAPASFLTGHGRPIWLHGALVKLSALYEELGVALGDLRPATNAEPKTLDGGIAMRFPRIHRIRWDKPAADADRLTDILAMIGA